MREAMATTSAGCLVKKGLSAADTALALLLFYDTLPAFIRSRRSFRNPDSFSSTILRNTVNTCALRPDFSLALLHADTCVAISSSVRRSPGPKSTAARSDLDIWNFPFLFLLGMSRIINNERS
jgi:hypothetical protein